MKGLRNNDKLSPATDRKHLGFSAPLGAGEERTEPYQEYGEGALEPATTRSAKSTGGLPSSTRERGGAAQVFALVDCNNFFVSCERIFRPDLEGRPVVVMSSNDGCVVARSNEAKALGIPMGAPVFKHQGTFERHNVVKFSANFELYGDISRRIIAILTTITPRLEIYSVDEAFLDLSQLAITDYTAWGKLVRQKILEWVGVPVSIGIAPTKTLAKLASGRAKKQPQLAGVLELTNSLAASRASYLQQTPVQDIWGVGWRLAPKLRAEGIASALQLSRMRPQLANQLMGVHGRQLVAELNGISCLPLAPERKDHQSIAVTRTFGKDTEDLGVLEAAITTFTATAALRLRRSGQVAHRATLFVASNKHKPGYRRWHEELAFPVGSADTGELLSALVAALRRVYRADIYYHRAGVLLSDLKSASQLQTDLLGEVDPLKIRRSQARMQAIDLINERYGGHAIRYAAERLGEVWQPQHNSRSPRYTTDWQALPAAAIRAGQSNYSVAGKRDKY